MSKKFTRKQIESAIRLYESILREFAENEADIAKFKDKILDTMRQYVNIISHYLRNDALIIRYKFDNDVYALKCTAYEQVINATHSDEEHDIILKLKNFNVIPAKNNSPYEEQMKQEGKDYEFNSADKDFAKRILEAIGIL